jgi:dTDP-glucose pyrophosphorylase
MNLFKLTPHIFTACRRIPPHPRRKEYEITSAIQYLIDHHLVPVKVLPVSDVVVDLTYSQDIPRVRAALQTLELGF